MKLPVYAKKIGVSYRTAWRYWQNGHIPGAYQLPSGTIIVPDPIVDQQEKNIHVAIYARVSSTENKKNLMAQAQRLEAYCLAKGYTVKQIVQEVGSGVNDKRKKLIALLGDKSIEAIVVEHKDRLTRFGFYYIETLLAQQKRRIEVVNHVADDKLELMQDFISIITSFCARIYGLRRSKRKTEKLIKELESAS